MEQTCQAPEVNSSAAGKHAAALTRSHDAGCRTPNAASRLCCGELPASRKSQHEEPLRLPSDRHHHGERRWPQAANLPASAAPPPYHSEPPSSLPELGLPPPPKRSAPSVQPLDPAKAPPDPAAPPPAAAGMARARLTAASSTGGRARPHSPHERERRPRRRLPRGHAGSRRPAQAAVRRRAWEVVVAARVSRETARHPRGGDEPSRSRAAPLALSMEASFPSPKAPN
jgi:hypothetical protein